MFHNGKPQTGGYVNFFLLAVYRWTGLWTKALQLNSQAEGQDSLRQAIMYDYNCNNKSNREQFKETVSAVRIDFSQQELQKILDPSRDQQTGTLS